MLEDPDQLADRRVRHFLDDRQQQLSDVPSEDREIATSSGPTLNFPSLAVEPQRPAHRRAPNSEKLSDLFVGEVSFVRPDDGLPHLLGRDHSQL